jgi:hypothetical protein
MVLGSLEFLMRDVPYVTNGKEERQLRMALVLRLDKTQFLTLS